jgi:hypothetical protein
MTQSELYPKPEDREKVFLAMRGSMWKHALHHIDRIGPRTIVSLQDLDLFDISADKPIGAGIDLDVLSDPSHPRREPLPPGPLLLYVTIEDSPKRILVEIPTLFFPSSQRPGKPLMDT